LRILCALILCARFRCAFMVPTIMAYRMQLGQNFQPLQMYPSEFQPAYKILPRLEPAIHATVNRINTTSTIHSWLSFNRKYFFEYKNAQLMDDLLLRIHAPDTGERPDCVPAGRGSPVLPHSHGVALRKSTTSLGTSLVCRGSSMARRPSPMEPRMLTGGEPIRLGVS
jgi:hypothetical protein